jgi:hypothetical protein
LVSDELVEKHFICNLQACKGACCWEGDAGAPLEEAEKAILNDIFPTIRAYLSLAGIRAIEEQGTYQWYDNTESWGTTLIDGGPCAFMTYDALGIAKCGIEQAHKDGVIDFLKPISCHLYPIRVSKSEELGFEALNYDEWDICSAACALGEREQVPVYVFVKDALVRQYGQDFYDELDGAATFLRERGGSEKV